MYKNLLSLLIGSKDSSLIDLELFPPQTEAIKIFLPKLGAPVYDKCLHTEIFYCGCWVLGGHPA